MISFFMYNEEMKLRLTEKNKQAECVVTKSLGGMIVNDNTRKH